MPLYYATPNPDVRGRFDLRQERYRGEVPNHPHDLMAVCFLPDELRDVCAKFNFDADLSSLPPRSKTMSTPSEYFALFLTALRNSGTSIDLNDKAVALMIADALDVLSPDSDVVTITASELGFELRELADGGFFAEDNGSDGEDT